MNNVCEIKATKQTCSGNFRLWTRTWSMKCLERIASFYLPKYLIATYIVEITSGWRVIETIASFCTIFYRTPSKTQIKKSQNIFHANCVTQLMLYTGDKLSSTIFCCLSVCLSVQAVPTYTDQVPASIVIY